MKSEYILTLADVSQIPGLFNGPFLKGHRDSRIALVGRSNVGKSSLINALLKAKLAQISKQPGKTRAIHFYHWKDCSKIIADLPGYGYARASWTERERWETFIRAYFEADENLREVMLVLDARHGPTDSDLEAIQFLRSEHVSIKMIFSKFDALKTQSERALRKKEATGVLQDLGVPAENIFWVSSHSGAGLKELAQSLSRE